MSIIAFRLNKSYKKYVIIRHKSMKGSFVMSKIIKNYSELVKVCRSAGLWYVGTFMSEFLAKRELWSDSERKGQFIHYMLSNYNVGDSAGGAITRMNCVIRIIESKMVKEALQMVLDCNDKKIGSTASKDDAQRCLDEIQQGIYKL